LFHPGDVFVQNLADTSHQKFSNIHKPKNLSKIAKHQESTKQQIYTLKNDLKANVFCSRYTNLKDLFECFSTLDSNPIDLMSQPN